ncbi:uncharacterized protein LOC116416092 [Nasonia vitripennis]|uniref:Uncharacterized protein n=1 Tax=Nasonia vitripennis TaxID=7425 RepID=A0A7M7Q2A9_NASVI|nr:uncharacterized protein LOC116416092 [Nasonia vitripennis]
MMSCQQRSLAEESLCMSEPPGGIFAHDNEINILKDSYNQVDVTRDCKPSILKPIFEQQQQQQQPLGSDQQLRAVAVPVPPCLPPMPPMPPPPPAAVSAAATAVYTLPELDEDIDEDNTPM